MKCVLFVLCLMVFGVPHASPSSAETTKLLNRLLQLLEVKNVHKRYHYIGSPAVNQNNPGMMWVDLQAVVEVEAACPSCHLYIAFQCVSTDCHNKAERFYPTNGYTWGEFEEIFVNTGEGKWISGLENGMEYEVWDLVKDGNDVYTGYNNTARPTVTIP